ncbi:MAG: SGNH/GDSL hydrolase family protein [Bacillota bacterium]
MSLELKKSDVIVFEGDSLTRRDMSVNLDDWPFLRMMNWDDTWVNTVQELLFSWHPELELKFHTAAVGGSHIGNLLERLDANVLAFKPDWIIITVGNNDTNIFSVEEFAVKLREYVSLVASKSKAKILFLGGFKKAKTFVGEENFFTSSVAYHEILEIIALESGNYFLDIGRFIVEKSETLFSQSDAHTVYGDGVHFNKLGNNIIAGEVLKVFGYVN